MMTHKGDNNLMRELWMFAHVGGRFLRVTIGQMAIEASNHFSWIFPETCGKSICWLRWKHFYDFPFLMTEFSKVKIFPRKLLTYLTEKEKCSVKYAPDTRSLAAVMGSRSVAEGRAFWCLTLRRKLGMLPKTEGKQNPLPAEEAENNFPKHRLHTHTHTEEISLLADKEIHRPCTQSQLSKVS